MYCTCAKYRVVEYYRVCCFIDVILEYDITSNVSIVRNNNYHVLDIVCSFVIFVFWPLHFLSFAYCIVCLLAIALPVLWPLHCLSFGHCIACLSSIYGFCYPLWYHTNQVVSHELGPEGIMITTNITFSWCFGKQIFYNDWASYDGDYKTFEVITSA